VLCSDDSGELRGNLWLEMKLTTDAFKTFGRQHYFAVIFV